MKIKQLKLFDVLIYLISIVLVFYFYDNVITSPNSYMFNNSGDGIKNYYTFAYHIKNDSSFTEFEGMNYPFGEHFFYTDSHPIITIILQSIAKVYPNIVYYSVGIINFLMILSIFLTYIVLYFLLRRFKISELISFFGAISIGMLAPQLFRLTGHYALSYSVAIPLTWLLLIRYNNKSTVVNIFLLSLNNLFWILIHAYLGIILIGFVFFYYIFDLLFYLKVNIKNQRKHLVFILSVFVPILVYLLVIYFTDNHLNRTNNPSGFFQYNAELDDILLPHFGLIKINIEKFVLIKQQWEGWAYVGIVSSIIFIIMLFSFIYYLIKRKLKLFNEKYFNNYQLKISFLSSIALLIFSFGIPFRQFHGLIDVLPIFKQFRATGRFDWVFFFVFSVVALVFVNRLFLLLSKTKRFYAYGFIVIVFSLYFYDGWVQQSYMSSKITINENVFKRSYKDKLEPLESNIDFSKFQAIIPMPFYHFGSEVYSVSAKNKIVQTSMIYSYHYNLPMLSAYLTRVSIDESKKIISILSPTFYKKALQKDIKSDNPFLIIESKETKTKYEKAIIKRSEFLFSLNGFNFYKLLPENLFKYTAKQDVAYFDKTRDVKLNYKNGFYLSDTTLFYYYNNFNYNKNTITHTGDGSGVISKKNENLLIEFVPETFKTDKTYNISLWVYNADYNLNEHFRFGLVEYNTKGIVYEKEFYPEYSQIISDDWSKVYFDFKINNTKNKLKLYSKGSVYSTGNIIYDDIFVFEYPLNAFKVLEQKDYKTKELFFNNNILK